MIYKKRLRDFWWSLCLPDLKIQGDFLFSNFQEVQEVYLWSGPIVEDCSRYQISSYRYQLVNWSLFLFVGHTSEHVGSQYPNQGSNPHALAVDGVLITGPPGKSLKLMFKVNLINYLLRNDTVIKIKNSG